MKKQFLLLFLFVTISNYGQMAVTDVTANETLATQLTTSTNQLAQLEKSYQVLKEAEEKYQKINSIVTSVYKIGEIIELQREAIENINIVRNNKKSADNPNLLENMNHILLSINQRVNTISNVLKEGFFNMSDKERIDMFKSERSAIFFQVSKTRGYANTYRIRN
ncbi:hypothetical protein EV196_11321 [Mariniflexile fucanivorans]|uniref:Uncharacterized protein n=1 Tax=Mariniflexile fucanivorans TaxID=264023 RepID=A0A4R1RA66_9FLAO|nr:hypothetical protein [Mariniflexile fucanivorans]TCL62480.1 hypothetical protein EV196_11321 [Mariniflexile fucanivorans]